MVKAMKDVELSEFCHQASLLVRSGVTVGEAVGILAEAEPDVQRRSALTKISDDTMGGVSLSRSAEDSGLFPAYMLTMLKAGESAGALESVLEALSLYYFRAARTKRSLRAAVSYPLLMLAAVLAVLVVFVTKVLPIFESVFSRIGADIGGPARLFLGIGQWLAGAAWLWWLLVILAAAVVLCCVVPAGKKALVRAAYRTKTGKTLASSHAAQVLSLGLAGTGDADRALELACRLEEGGSAAMEECRKLAAQGEPLSQASRESGLFAPEYCRMLWLGERSGNVEGMMSEVAQRLSAKAHAALDSLSSGVEAAVVSVMLLGIGFLLLSVMLPLAGIMSAL